MAYPPAWKLIIYSLLPSWTSFLGVLSGAILFIAGHLLMLSLAAGTIFTNLWGGSLSLAYTNFVVQPLLYVFSLGNFGVAMNIIIWGLLGWFIFSIGEVIARTIREWRESEDDIVLNGHLIVQDPMHVDFMIRTLWQLACVAGFILFAIQAPSIFDHVLAIDNEMFVGQPFTKTLVGFAQAVLLCMLLEHCIIVLLRLYSFRTRLTETPRYR